MPQETRATRDNVRVVVRVRPPVDREVLDEYEPFASAVATDASGRNPGAITLCDDAEGLAAGSAAAAHGAHSFAFDRVFSERATQREVYDTCARDAVVAVTQGFNATLIAYGQTGTGKTFTMEGVHDAHGAYSTEDRGIIPRSIDDVFRHIREDSSPASRYLVRASMLQIYNDNISDLLKEGRANLGVREDKKRGVYVDGLSEWVVRSPAEIYDLMRRGQAARVTAATRANEASSRSHAIFMLVVEHSSLSASAEGSSEAPSRTFRVGKLNLVDLAGSERVAVTGASGQRMNEAKKINQSLSALGNVIAALTDARPRPHIPYRDAKLTRILESSLGGNCRTTMIATITPARASLAESLSTLKFASRAKKIRNAAFVNEDLDQKTLLRRYERELKALREELSARNKDLVDKRRLLKLEEEKRKAERDKLAALTELEERSRDFMAQKEQRVELEARIQEMQSQLLTGGGKVEEMPAVRNLLAAEHARIRSEYEKRLATIEAERKVMEEDKAQVDRYKSLLLKQRDIMIALTARLNERDEQIVSLQEELEVYDRHQKDLEDTLDKRTGELFRLRKAAVEHTTASPLKNDALVTALGSWAGGVETQGGALNATQAGSADEARVESEALRQARAEAERQTARVAQLEAEAAGHRAAAAELERLRAAAGVAGKERAALRTILEHKVSTLVSSISSGVSAIPDGAAVRAAPRLQREVHALGKLVSATVTALAQSSANTGR